MGRRNENPKLQPGRENGFGTQTTVRLQCSASHESTTHIYQSYCPCFEYPLHIYHHPLLTDLRSFLICSACTRTTSNTLTLPPDKTNLTLNSSFLDVLSTSTTPGTSIKNNQLLHLYSKFHSETRLVLAETQTKGFILYCRFHSEIRLVLAETQAKGFMVISQKPVVATSRDRDRPTGQTPMLTRLVQARRSAVPSKPFVNIKFLPWFTQCNLTWK